MRRSTADRRGGRIPPLYLALGVVLGLSAVLAFLAAVVLGGDDDGGPAPSAGGGTMRVAVIGMGSLDPLDARDPSSLLVADQIFDTMVRYDDRTAEPEAGLSTWEANPEQTVFTFKLKAGATFHDASPITAGDVKFSLERVAAKGSTSPLLSQLDSVVGFGEWNGGTAPGLAGIEAPDPATVVVRLDKPFATFPAVLGNPGFGVVPKAAVEGQGEAFKSQPVGSGPFKVSSVIPQRVRLARFGGREPKARIDRIDLLRYADAGAAYGAFRRGDLDLSPVPPAEVSAAAKANGGRGMRPIGVLFYAVNVKAPGMADARFREAISLAVDRAAIVKDVYQSSVEVAASLVAPGVPGASTDSCGERCAFDPERAEALVKEVYPDGNVPEVTIDHDDDATQAAVAGILKADLEAVGIPATLRSHPFSEYGTFIVSGQQQLFRYGWVAAYPSPDGFLAPLFLSSSPENLTGLANPTVDDELRAARAEPDPARRATLFKQAEQKILDEHVVVLLAELETRMVVSERVEGFKLNPLGTFDGAAVRLAEE